MKAIYHFFISFIFVTLALALFAVLFLPAIGLALFTSFFRFRFLAGLKNLSQWLRSLALSLDQMGNVFCQSLFNYTLIKRSEGYAFGDPDETISSVLGRNKKRGTLTRTGRVLVWLLGVIDRDHAIKSIGS